MSNFVVVNDFRGNVFRHVIKYDLDADAVWFRFNSFAEMCRSPEGVLQHFDPVNAFLLMRVISGPANPRLSEFQGAYGRANLYHMNKNKTFRKKLAIGKDSFFLDGAPAHFEGEWEEYLKAVYNNSFGFLVGGDSDLSSLIDGAFYKNNLFDFFSHIIDNFAFVGLFLQDHRGARSLVLIGRDLPHGIMSATDWIYETPDTTLECVHAYGDWLANQHVLQRALRCEEQ